MLRVAEPLTAPIDHINTYPTLVEKRDMYGDKAEKQADKINEIVSSMFDDFNVKTTPAEQTLNNTYRASSYRTQLVDNVKDVCYNEYANLSFEFYTSNITKYTVTPIMRLNVDELLGEIMFTGLDSKTNPTRTLAQYGYFILTYNDIANEKQLSFVAIENTPEIKWYVSMMFIVNKKVDA